MMSKFDEDKENNLIGKHIIIGITIIDYKDDLVEQFQLHGNIIRINQETGVVVKLHNSDEEYTLPPDLSAIQEAPEGEYCFKLTGEVVVNPDLMTSWTIHQPNPNKHE